MSSAAVNDIQSSGFFTQSLTERDPEIAGWIAKELGRQKDKIELIASENITSRAVLEATGSILTNKYAEGYPGKRYYGGCEYVDEIETIAIERAKQLFGCEFANVQPNSGSQMNQAVFLALLQPGDTFMGLDLNAGGHLTHGSPVNMSGKWFNPIGYGVRRDDHRIDMDEVARIARENKPKLIICGGTAYSRGWDWARFREIADEVGAYLLADMSHISGLVAGGAHSSPVPHAHVTTSTTHKSLRGPRSGPHDESSVDYPDYGYKLATAVADGTAERGIALCGSGIGISIAVNRNPAARAALVSEPLSARLAREHNDANVIAMGARLIGIEMAKACLDAFLTTEFGGDRHQRRVDKLSNPNTTKEPS